MRNLTLRCGGLLLLCLFVPGIAAARPEGRKANCPALVERLTALELSGASEAQLRHRRNQVADRCVALNEVQVLGSHNSYHQQPRPELLSLLVNIDPMFSAWEYSHPYVFDQLETFAVRQIELDVFADPLGGLYADRHGLIAVNEEISSGIPALSRPGFKVMHVQDLDFETTCYTFVDCLKEIKRWSNRNRGHMPLMVLIEAKDDPIADPFNFGFVTPVPIGAAEFDAIDAEIRSVFGPRRLLTPDDVRQGQPTLESAVLGLGWPRLGSVRNRVMFTLDNGGAYRDNYLAGHPSLQGRVMFTDSLPGSPEAAFVKMNDPLPDTAAIQTTVAAGYVVRTRADSDTVEARSGDTSRRDAALASGAQWVSTDYERADVTFGTGYVVAIPGGSPARCNPISATSACRSAAIERLP